MIATGSCTGEGDSSDEVMSMLNAGAALTIDCWLKIMSSLDSLFLLFDSSAGVFYCSCSLNK